MEEWRPVVDHEKFYEVSSLGRIRSLDRVVKCIDGRSIHKSGRIMSPSPDGGGYLQVDLNNCGTRDTRKLHRIVLEAFVGQRGDGLQCDHIDGDKNNNSISNLRWVTPRENCRNRTRHGGTTRGDKCSFTKLDEFRVRIIKTILRDSGHNHGCMATLAKTFGVSFGTIGAIKCGKSWAWLEI